MPRKGRALEVVTELLYRVEAANGGAGVVIEEMSSPGFATDTVTGEAREFDVLARGKLGHLPFSIGIEVKDWSTRVGSPVVESFAAKCAHTNIQLK